LANTQQLSDDINHSRQCRVALLKIKENILKWRISRKRLSR